MSEEFEDQNKGTNYWPVKSTQYNIYLQYISQNMQELRYYKVVNVNHHRCNFCNNWCQIPNPLQKGDLLCCPTCETTFTSNGRKVLNTQGETFTLYLDKTGEQKMNEMQPARGQFEFLMNNDVQETFLRWSRIQTLFEENDFTTAEIETIQEKIQHFQRGYEEESQNLVEFIKNINHCKSNTSLQGSTEQINQIQTSQSLVQIRNENQLNQGSLNLNLKFLYKSTKKQQNLEEYCKQLGATRCLKRYSYYFDTSQLKRYKDVAKPLKTRQFGCELSPNLKDFSTCNSNRQQSSKTLDSHKAKFNRSFLSQISAQKQKSLKLSDQQLKSKILSYLQPRSQSFTMIRIMATFVREAYLRTNLQPSSLELISFRVSNMDLHCYFSLFDLSSVHTLKFVNVGLTDQQLLTLLDLVGGSVQRLVLTGNCLTQLSLPVFLSRSLPNLRELYLGKNRISKYRMKENILQLKSRVLLYL